jgi:hypothetical protein
MAVDKLCALDVFSNNYTVISYLALSYPSALADNFVITPQHVFDVF